MQKPTEIVEDGRARYRAILAEVVTTGLWLTSDQINARQIVPRRFSEEPAYTWKTSQRIFSLMVAGKERFAGYQFDAACKPLPIIRDILEVFGTRHDPWTIAVWFHLPTGWIAGTGAYEGKPIAPMCALDRPDDVLRAAQFIHGGYVA